MKELYTDETIYEINDNITSKITASQDIKAYILVEEADLRSENKQKLIEILKAIKLELDHNALIVQLTAHQCITLGSLGHQSQKPLIISFGLSSDQLCLQSLTADYFIHRFENLNLVMAHSLDKLINDTALKGKLWNCIKHFKPV